MREKVRICGEYFEISAADGGQLRATSESLPGFELIAANHNLLRMRMHRALQDYDRQQLLKPQEQQPAPQITPFGLKPITSAPMPTPVMGAGQIYCPRACVTHAYQVPMNQIIGIPGRISQLGAEYRRIGVEIDDKSPSYNLVAQLELILRDAYRNGATDVVWLTKPFLCSVASNSWRLEARCHFEPRHVNNACPYWWNPGTAPMRI